MYLYVYYIHVDFSNPAGLRSVSVTRKHVFEHVYICIYVHVYKDILRVCSYYNCPVHVHTCLRYNTYSFRWVHGVSLLVTSDIDVGKISNRDVKTNDHNGNDGDDSGRRDDNDSDKVVRANSRHSDSGQNDEGEGRRRVRGQDVCRCFDPTQEADRRVIEASTITTEVVDTPAVDVVEGKAWPFAEEHCETNVKRTKCIVPYVN